MTQNQSDRFAAVFKAYDVRGRVPDELDASMCRSIGAAFARFADAPRILVARDMRPSGVEMVAEFVEGARSQGVDVLDLGLGSTDLLYFASGRLGAPGVVFTASHNPAGYNGIKMCLAKAAPIGSESADSPMIIGTDGRGRCPDPSGSSRGTSTAPRTCSVDYVEHVHSFVDRSALKPD